jgi:hypothetical protein
MFAQGWEKCYTTIYNADELFWVPGGEVMSITPDGGMLMAGTFADSAINNGCVLKTDMSGNIMWKKKISGFQYINVACFLSVADGYLIGGSISPPQQSFIIKVDLSGNQIWSKTYSNLSKVTQMFQNGSRICITGNAPNGSSVAMLDMNGNVHWAKSISQNIYSKGIIQTENNGVLLAGNDNNFTYGNGDKLYLTKFDSVGNIVWSKNYGYTVNYSVSKILELDNGDYLLGGSVLMRVDHNGNLKWARLLYDRMVDMDITSDGELAFVTGDYWTNVGISLYKTTIEGQQIWKRSFGIRSDRPTAIECTADNSFLIAGCRVGTYESPVTGLLLLKADSTGNTGCNTDIFSSALLSHTPQCIQNNSTLTMTNGASASPLSFTFGDPAINLFDPCCTAVAEIKCGNYHICEGDSITFEGSGGPQLLWHNGSTNNSIKITDTVAYLTVTNTCGSFHDTLSVDPSPIPPLNYTVSNYNICAGQTVNVALSTTAPMQGVQGPFVGHPSTTSYTLSPTSTTTYTAYASTAYYAPGCVNSQSFTITVNPDKPTITRNGDTLFSSAASGNQWYLDSIAISGSTNSWIIISNPGNYYVSVSAGSCSNSSDSYEYIPDEQLYEKVAWQKIIGDSVPSSGIALVQAADGGIIIAGHRNYLNQTDALLTKTTRNGELLWARTYGGNNWDQFNSIIKTGFGYVAAGSTKSFGAGNLDGLICAFDTAGNLLWSKTVGDWNDQEFYSVSKCADGGYIFCGSTTDPDSYAVDSWGDIYAHLDILLVKTDAAGEVLWSKRYDNSEEEVGIEAHELADGSIIAAGTLRVTPGYGRVLVIKTNSSGDQLWTAQIANQFFAETASMKLSPDNGIIVCTGATGSTYLLKLDSSGAVEWSQIIEAGTWGSDLYITSDSAAVVTSGFGYLGGGITKVDMNGNLIWSNSCGSLYNTHANSIIELDDGSFAISGLVDTTNHYSPGNLLLMNTDNSGRTNCNVELQPEVTYEPTVYHSSVTNVYDFVASYPASLVEFPSTFTAKTICKSALATGIAEHNSTGSELLVYPNPATGHVNIRLMNENVELLRLHDITGRTVLYQKGSGNNTDELQLQEAPGIYFLEVSTKNNIYKTKLVLTQ